MRETDTSSTSLCFSKPLRLLKAGDFQRVFDEAPYRASHQYLMLLARPGATALPRMGLVVAKKNIRLAAQRNRFKRIARECFRLQRHHLPAIDVIVLARKNADSLTNSELFSVFDDLWKRVAQKARKVEAESSAGRSLA